MTSDKTVTANFTQIEYTLTVDVSPGDGGIIEVNGAAPPSYPATYTFAHGASVDLEAVPASGYTFVSSWSGDLPGSENPTTITMDSDKEVTADFINFTKVAPSPFPWWWIVIGVGVMVVGLPVYFLVIGRLRT